MRKCGEFCPATAPLAMKMLMPVVSKDSLSALQIFGSMPNWCTKILGGMTGMMGTCSLDMRTVWPLTTGLMSRTAVRVPSS